MFYGIKCWDVKKQHVHKMRMLRCIIGNTRKYRIQNVKICLKIGVTLIDEKMMENSLRCMFWSYIKELEQLMH